MQTTAATPAQSESVAIIGGGPTGLMAAEVLLNHGLQVDLYDRMPSLGRKLLIAGRGGLNLSHAEPLPAFIQRYGARSEIIGPMVEAFDAQALRDWAKGLGIDTFIGSSQRIFPTDFKAAPLLRAWLHRLREQGLRIHVRHRWLGWGENNALRFESPLGITEIQHRATLLALGGGSWAKLGADGKWVEILAQRGIALAPLRPSNCGFETNWSKYFRDTFASEPLKSVAVSVTTLNGDTEIRQGELMIADYGLEGGAIYALSAPIRDLIDAHGTAEIHIDLVPGRSLERLQTDLATPRGRNSLSKHLQRHAGIKGAKASILREVLNPEQMQDPAQVATTLKALPIHLHTTRPIDEAISTAGGVRFDALTTELMIKALPGTFCAGEMLDWEAPTGGYLLTACFASGREAAQGILSWLSPP